MLLWLIACTQECDQYYAKLKSEKELREQADLQLAQMKGEWVLCH